MNISERRGSFDWAHPNEKQRVLAINNLPEDAPAKSVSAVIDEDVETGDLPPSEVVEIISEQIEKAWISTSREKDRKTIEWIRDNSERLDKMWAKDEIERCQRKVKRYKNRIANLKQNFDLESEAENEN
jgi:polyhydroxyalkanoate synthesis regulator phasin